MTEIKKEVNPNDLSKELFKYQPHEIIGVIFDYFATALEDADDEKIIEFGLQFEVGVRDQIRYHKTVKGKELTEDEKYLNKREAVARTHDGD